MFSLDFKALFTFGRGIYVCYTFRRFTSGVIPAHLLVAIIAVKPFYSMYLQAGTGGAQNWDLLCHKQTMPARLKVFKVYKEAEQLVRYIFDTVSMVLLFRME